MRKKFGTMLIVLGLLGVIGVFSFWGKGVLDEARSIGMLIVNMAGICIGEIVRDI